MTNNEVPINFGSGTDPISSVTAWLTSGYAGGAWNGPGVISSVAQTTGASYGLATPMGRR